MVDRAFIAVLGMAMFLFQGSLEEIAHFELPGPKGQRFDYLAVDGEDHYLLSAHLGPGILYVIDMRTNKLVKAIPWAAVVPPLTLLAITNNHCVDVESRINPIPWIVITEHQKHLEAGPCIYL